MFLIYLLYSTFQVINDYSVSSTAIKAALDAKFSSEQPALVAALLLIVFLIGQLSNQISEYFFKPFEKKTERKGDWIRRIVSWVIFFPTVSKPVDSYDKSLIDLNEIHSILVSYGVQAKPDSWASIYGSGSRLLFALGTRSRLSTYQNKYTLHRSLTFLFSIGSRFLFFALCLCVYREDAVTSLAFWLAVALFMNILLTFQFRHGYRRNWTLYGNQICWELQALKPSEKAGLLKGASGDARP